MRILRAICKSDSASDSFHRVKVSASGFFDNLLVDNVNGVYLRSGDEVYLSIQDDFTEPLILGRCSGQLELQDLVNIINGLVDVINSNKTVFNSHVHTGGTISGSTGSPTTTFTGADKCKPDDFLY